MDVVPFVDQALGNSSYLVGLGEGRAMVVDPVRDVKPYRSEAERRQWVIDYALETHLHADFVSGSRELALLGAQVVAPAAAGLEFPHRGLGEDEELELGGLDVRAVPTPGHTPEHLAYLVSDGSHPMGLFSGGSLLVGSVARTDLISPESTEELTRRMHRIARPNLLGLPDDLPVHPTHGAGSFCSVGSTGAHTTTIGAERTANPLLATGEEDVFVARLLGGLGSYPTYFLRLREVNRRGPQVYGDHPLLSPLTVEQIDRLVAEGAELIDARSGGRFCAAHLPGSLSIALRPAFASWLGWLVPMDRPLVFVLDGDQDRLELVRQCLAIGYEDLAGELAGGIGAWRAAGREVRSTRQVGPGELEGRVVVDVRQVSEYRAGHIPGSVNIELGSLPTTADALPDREVVVHCVHGERATTGASVLERLGRREVAVMGGGPDDWTAATGVPLV